MNLAAAIWKQAGPQGDPVEDLLNAFQPWTRIAVGAALLVVGSILALLVVRRGRKFLGEPPAGRPLPAVVPLLAGAVFLCALTFLPRPSADGPLESRLPGFLWLASASLAAASLAALVGLWTRGGQSSDLGLCIRRPGASLALAPALYITLLPALLGVAVIKSGIYALLGEVPPSQLTVDALATSPELRSNVLFLATIVVLQPFLEEVLYRGVVLSFFLGVLKPFPAVFAGAFLFACVHDAGRIEVFLLALGLGWLYASTRSLLAPALLHIMHNGLTILIILTLGDRP